MSYTIRHGKLMQDSKPKWKTVPYEETAEDRYWDAVSAKIKMLFGDEFEDYSREQQEAAEEAAIAALAQEGIYMPEAGAK